MTSPTPPIFKIAFSLFLPPLQRTLSLSLNLLRHFRSLSLNLLRSLSSAKICRSNTFLQISNLEVIGLVTRYLHQSSIIKLDLIAKLNAEATISYFEAAMIIELAGSVANKQKLEVDGKVEDNKEVSGITLKPKCTLLPNQLLRS
ncbi:uncharacterized protein [Spinacia oleracea]|uniref:LisH domain-containing protein n=1 Tax=Spinacia oleracea TaxID=3562 RepID=A0ABM3RB50_SPIOL|nr:uncharacterized protein LOC110787129 [Spinacia oleracea]